MATNEFLLKDKWFISNNKTYKSNEITEDGTYGIVIGCKFLLEPILTIEQGGETNCKIYITNNNKIKNEQTETPVLALNNIDDDNKQFVLLNEDGFNGSHHITLPSDTLAIKLVFTGLSESNTAQILLKS